VEMVKHGVQELQERELFMEITQIFLKKLKMKPEFLNRNLNEGFSGGEKKRNEILQMSVLNPKLSILDETDSGLDIDALKDVANGINNFFTKEKSIILITHYQRLLDYVKPDFVHIMHKGEIIKTGDSSLAIELENKGYDWIIN
jgi:Fe-S cluster assembly ATP-binding protein